MSLFAVLAVAGAVTISGQSKPGTDADLARIPAQKVWPLPPDPARVTWIAPYSTGEDLEGPPKKSSLDASRKVLLGKNSTTNAATMTRGLGKPHGVAVDSSGRVFVADTEQAAVFVPDLRARRALLAGQDVLASVEVSLTHLRHQCEYELRSKLIGLRQAYLLAPDDPGVAQRLLAQAAGGLAPVLRQLVYLGGQVPPDDPTALVTEVAPRYGVDASALSGPFEARRLPVGAAQRAEALFAAHLGALETLIGAADANAAR